MQEFLQLRGDKQLNKQQNKAELPGEVANSKDTMWETQDDSGVSCGSRK